MDGKILNYNYIYKNYNKKKKIEKIMGIVLKIVKNLGIIIPSNSESNKKIINNQSNFIILNSLSTRFIKPNTY